MTFDAVVVGSGFGGAVAAARLSAAGMRVCVLERGIWWGPGDDRRPFPRGAGIAGALRNVRVARGAVKRNVVLDKAGLFEIHLHQWLDVITASGVGGGSLIYTNVQEPPDDAVMASFPPELRGGEIVPYVDKVRSVLRPRPITDATSLPIKNVAFAAIAEKAGMGEQLEVPDIAVALGDPDVPTELTNAAGVHQRTCNFCGNCVIGCMESAKTTLDLTYVPMALAAGTELRTLAEADAVAPAGRSWQVRYLDHASGRRRTVTGDRVVLAAGTLGTLRLLLRSRDRFRTLPSISTRLGAGFSGNGDQINVLAATGTGFGSGKGPTFNQFVRTRASDGTHRFVVGEAGIPPGMVGSLAERLASWHLLISMGADASAGSVTLDGDELDVDTSNEDDPELFAAIDATMEALGDAAGARRVRRLSTRPSPKANATAHPLGGAGMGSTAEDGVTDHMGRVFGVPGLFVADGSLYPRAPGLPPSLTIAALAERIAHLMIEETP